MNDERNSDSLARLQQWFLSHCNDRWEHAYGIKIDTLDNPGWSVDVDLKDTELATRQFFAVTKDRTENDWVHCVVEEQVFRGRGGPKNLEEIICSFLDWAESSPR